MHRFLVASLALTLAAHPLARAQRATDTTATIASLRAADSALAAAAAAQGPTAFLDAFEPDAALLFPGQPILRADSGRAAFLARYAAPSVYAWRPLHAVVSVDGRLGCTVGLSRFRDAHDSTRTERGGAYETCWRRDDGGRWRIVGHQRNDSPAQAPDAENERRTLWPHSATVSRPGDQHEETLDTDTRFARFAAESAGPGPAFARFAAADGMTIGGRRFQFGRDEILAVFAGYPADRYIAWEPDRRFGAGSGGLAFTVGHSDHLPRAGRPGQRFYGKFLTVWRQREDGAWEFVFDLGSPRVEGRAAGS
jgi:ketosteroid isomerase-like protein